MAVKVAGFCIGGMRWARLGRGAREARIAREGTKAFLVTSMLHDLGRRGIIYDSVNL